MAARSNRSPSPLSSKPINPNPRNSDNQSTARRSFNGNNPFPKPSTLINPRKFDPISPANSPSDFTRRRSVDKECSGSYLRNREEKENDEKDQILKPSKLQTPTKGCKNFMAPTISAASKFTPSPRKKPLVERNDPVRTSISLSDGKAMFFSNVSEDLEPKSEMCFDENQKIPTSLDSKVSDLEKKESDQDPQSDSLKVEPSLKNNISTPISPLDADPSMPPYDPKTNFLSPRPQFLYYKPNPRIKVLLNKEKGTDTDDLVTLEDDSFIKEFMSDDFSSDSEVTEESDKENLEATTASADMVIGLNFSEEEDDDFHVSKDDPEKEVFEAVVSEDKVIGDDDDVIHESKSCGITKMMCFSMVIMMMLLMGGCISVYVTRPPSFGIIKDLSFSDLRNMYHQSRVVADLENLDRLVRRINQFPVGCVDFVYKMALGGGEATLGSVKYMNLSYIQMSSTLDYDDKTSFMNSNQVSEGLVVNVHDDDDEDEDLEKDACVESVDELDEDVKMAIFEEEEEEEVLCLENDDDFDDKKVDDVQDDDVLETQEKMPINSDYERTQSHGGEAIDDVLSIISTDELLAAHDQEIELEGDDIEITKSHVVEIEETNRDTGPISDTSPSDVFTSLTENVESPSSFKYKLVAHCLTIAISSYFAYVGFTYRYKRNPDPSLANVVQEEKKKVFSSQNWLQREVDGEMSCPSEMSSFEKSEAYYDNNKKEVREATEADRRTRKYYSKRESLASSLSEYTTGSPSYGSFTSFQKIPIKNANGEEEIITPVRRSSRIRSHQITSP